MFAARGDIAQYRHREVRWEELIMFSRQIITVFLCMNKGNNKITELRTILQRESQNS
jgi:hypothetical protein